MDLLKLHRKLITAARNTSQDDRVPYAFEKRIMAHLAGHKPLDAWQLWGHAFSKAAVFCVAFMLMISAGSYFAPKAPATTSSNTVSLTQAIDQTLFAAVDNTADSETWQE